MMEMKEVKLSILEPWELGTEKPVNASIVARNGKSYLIHLENPIKINNEEFQYLLSEVRDKNLDDNILSVQTGKYLLNMAYSKSLNKLNFGNSKISDFREGFLTGEVTII